MRLQLPPLRERSGDVSLLAKYFLENECTAAQSERKVFSAAALRKLESYCWPGNVRELFNTVQRAFLNCSGRQVLAEHVSPVVTTDIQQESNSALCSFRSAKDRAIKQFERAYLDELLARHHGNITQAAREADKDRRALGRLVKKYRVGSQIA